MGLRHTLILLYCCAALCATAQAPAKPIEQRIKAAFLYKFTEYVEWPGSAFASPESPLVIGVFDEAVAGELELAVAGRQVAGRAVNVRRLAAGGNDAGCHVIFVDASGGALDRTQALAHASGRAVLTVTDDNARHPPGSIINFVAADGRVRFDISREQAERNGLQLGSQLLRVARNVVPQ